MIRATGDDAAIRLPLHSSRRNAEDLGHISDRTVLDESNHDHSPLLDRVRELAQAQHSLAARAANDPVSSPASVPRSSAASMMVTHRVTGSVVPESSWLSAADEGWQAPPVVNTKLTG